MAQGEPQFLPVVIDPHNIRLQHFLMLRWVLLCDYCNYFLYMLKTSKLGWYINAYRIHDISYRCHCLLFRVCSSIELSSAFITTALEGATVVYISTPFFFELHDTEWGMPASFVHSLFLHTLWKVGFYKFPSPSKGDNPTISLSYNGTL
jgi:hypothetical protein